MKINRTVDRAISMLQLIAKHEEGLSLNEICEAMEIPKSSCFDILHTLVNSYMVEPIGKEGKIYRIGVQSFIIGNQYMENRRLVDVARNKIEKFGDTYGKSVFIAEDNLGYVVYVYKYQPKELSVVASCTVGTTNEYYNTALGKCMLAFKEDCMGLIEEFYREHKIDDKEKLIAQVEEIRRCKYVYSDQEHQKQLFCIAAPIFDHRGQVTSAVSVSGLYMDPETCEHERDDLRKMAEEISRDIGFIGIY